MKDIDWKELDKAAQELGKAYVDQIRKQLLRKRKTGWNTMATGNLSRSLKYSLIRTPFRTDIQIKSLPYLRYLDVGRKPGTPPKVGVIMKWMDVRKIATGIDPKERKGIAFAIVNSIAKKGFKGQPFNIVKNAIRNVERQKVTKTLQAASAKDAQRQLQLLFSGLKERTKKLK